MSRRIIVIGAILFFSLGVIVVALAAAFPVGHTALASQSAMTSGNGAPEPLLCNGAAVEFESGIPSDWTVVDNEIPISGPSVYWLVTGGNGYNGVPPDCGEGNYTDQGIGQAACASSRVYGLLVNRNYDTELRTQAFSLQNTSAVTLTYWAHYQNFSANDFFDLDISTTGGSSWDNLLNWNEDHPDNGQIYNPPGVTVTVSLNQYVEENNVILRWRYYNHSTQPLINDLYAQVDQVALACDVLVPENTYLYLPVLPKP